MPSALFSKEYQLMRVCSGPHTHICCLLWQHTAQEQAKFRPCIQNGLCISAQAFTVTVLMIPGYAG